MLQIHSEYAWADYMMAEIAVTEDRDEWPGVNSEVCLVGSVADVRDALVEDYRNAGSYDCHGHPVSEREEDLCGFLGRHKIIYH